MRNVLTLAAVTGAVAVIAVGASGASTPSGDWLAFGRTTDNMRHSPLTKITKANAGQLGRVYNIDLHALDPDTRRLIEMRLDGGGREAARNVFKLLMAKGEAGGRRAWMEEKGHLIEADV